MHLDSLRSQRISTTKKTHKAIYGQYLTPIEIANFMAALLIKYGHSEGNIELLDPGAGLGILFSAFLEKKIESSFSGCINIDAYEFDKTIIQNLNSVINRYKKYSNISIKLIQSDFIKNSAYDIGWGLNKKYSHIIMNPPYKKINSNSEYRLSLRDIGVETANLYSAFLAVSILQLQKNGVVVAILPRSFCNGLYFFPFRKFILKQTEIIQIHTFNSRRDAFKEESVLQENVIVVLRKGNDQPPNVCISSSEDKSLNDYSESFFEFSKIVNSHDEDKYIRIPALVSDKIKKENNIFTKFMELGIEISTGPIVDFRMKEKLVSGLSSNSIPLLYPIHFKGNGLIWPVVSKKPNSIILTDDEKSKIAYTNGCYVLVKRFSSKEEKKRIKAFLLLDNDIKGEYFTAENHLNIIHKNKHGIDKYLAGGLYVYLNTEYFDKKFREFSGHTQVNATDLKNIKYPTKEQIENMGIEYFKNAETDLDDIFMKVMKEYE